MLLACVCWYNLSLVGKICLLAWFISSLVKKKHYSNMHMNCSKCVYYVMYQHVSCGNTVSSKLSDVKFSVEES